MAIKTVGRVSRMFSHSEFLITAAVLPHPAIKDPSPPPPTCKAETNVPELLRSLQLGRQFRAPDVCGTSTWCFSWQPNIKLSSLWVHEVDVLVNSLCSSCDYLILVQPQLCHLPDSRPTLMRKARALIFRPWGLTCVPMWCDGTGKRRWEENVVNLLMEYGVEEELVRNKITCTYPHSNFHFNYSAIGYGTQWPYPWQPQVFWKWFSSQNSHPCLHAWDTSTSLSSPREWERVGWPPIAGYTPP